MTRIERAERSMFDQIYEAFLHTLNPRLTREQWQGIFDYPWRPADKPIGYVLKDGETLVGFVGLVFSEVSCDGKTEKHCNITSWIVDDDYRSGAAALVLPLLSLEDHTITNMTCTKQAFRVFSRLGFDALETHTRVLLPPWSLLARWRRGAARVSFDPDTIRPQLCARDARFLDDHRTYAQHCLAGDETGYCYLIYTRGRRRVLTTLRIHYISDRDRFARDIRSIQRALFQRHRAVLLECDERMVNGRHLPWSYSRRRVVPRLFRSARLSRDQIHNLYSEAVILAF